MKQSPIVGSSLIRARLLTTECEVLDPASPIENFHAEITFQINIVDQDKTKGATFDFYVDMAVTVVLQEGDNELVKAKCKFRGDFTLEEGTRLPKEDVESGPFFASQMLNVARPYLANTFVAMGINPTFLPFHIPLNAQPEKEEVDKKKRKKKS